MGDLNSFEIEADIQPCLNTLSTVFSLLVDLAELQKEQKVDEVIWTLSSSLFFSILWFEWFLFLHWAVSHHDISAV